MTSTAGLYVAIYRDEGVYKHWGLFIDGPTENQRLVLHVEGSSTRFRFDRKFSNARSSQRLSELIHLCDVPISNIAAIDQAAEQAPIHNQYPGYNCQDYVLELLDDLETRRLINGMDAMYKRQKALVAGKQEGL
ncbi:unnamed protein product [Penicillium salamii]|nr:unnamed protein product [Penicillium salamii]